MIRRRKNIISLIIAVILSSTLSFKTSAAFPGIKRLSGNDRYMTSCRVAQDGWSSSYYAILACGEDYPDALSSVPLAKKYDAPILLSHRNDIDSFILDELQNLHVGKVLVIGGSASVSDGVLQKLNSLGMQTERIGGADRYETSVKIAERFGKVKTLTVATGEDYADAISMGTVAASMGVPVILVPKNIMPDSVKNYITNLNTIKNGEDRKVEDSTSKDKNSGTYRGYNVFIVGDNNIISDNVVREFETIGKEGSVVQPFANVERITGENKYTRNINVIARFLEETKGKVIDNKYSKDKDQKTTEYSTEKDMLSLKNIFIASGEGFADALSGAALAAKSKSPIILSGTSNTDALKNFILTKNPNNNGESTNPEYLTVLGGEAVMPSKTVNQIFGYAAFDGSIAFNDSNPVKFTDNQFEKALRDKVGIHDRQLYYSDLKDITSLDLSNRGITNIAGIENCVNLKSLDLSYNALTDTSSTSSKYAGVIRPITSLNMLEELNLSHNGIKDISFISNLAALKTLNLSDNKIDTLNNSRKLYKDKNDGGDQYPQISQNVFKNLIHLQVLDLSNSDRGKSNNKNTISSASNFKDLISLTNLNLKGTNVSNLDSLKDITTLTTLNISNTNNQSLNFVKNLKALTYLDISHNNLYNNDIKALKDLSNLRYLDASNNKFDDITPLKSLVNLNTLYLEDNPIKDYTPILGYSDSLYFRDFNVKALAGNVSYSSDFNIDAEIKSQIETFQNNYGYTNYEGLRYRQLYRSYDSGVYNSQLQKLNAERNWLNYRISIGGFTEKDLKDLKDDLDRVTNEIADINKKDEMNNKIKDLEAQLSSAYNTIQKEKIINKINYVYSDYRYDYYRAEVDRCNRDIDEIRADLQVISSDSPSYEGNAAFNYLKCELDKIQRDRDVADDKVDTYNRYKDFFNGISAVLEAN